MMRTELTLTHGLLFGTAKGLSSKMIAVRPCSFCLPACRPDRSPKTVIPYYLGRF